MTPPSNENSAPLEGQNALRVGVLACGNSEPSKAETPPPQNASPTSSSIPYRPLPPIRTVPDPPPRPSEAKVLGKEGDELTPEQIANWRKVIALQFNPFVAQFLSDNDVRWYRDAIQAALKER